MKKNLLYTAIVLLLATLAGCSKSQTVVESREMVLRPVMATSPMGDMSEESDTKADPDLSGTTLGTDNSYVIYTSASSEKYPAFMTGQLYSYITATSAWEASSSAFVADPEYWPLGGEYLDFLAYACKPAAQTALKTAPTALAWNTGQSANGFTITGWDTYDKQYDLMFAVANGQTAAAGSGIVNMTFRHSMAVLGFSIKSTMADIYTLHEIKIHDLEYEGTFTVDNAYTEFKAGWTVTSAAADKSACRLEGISSTGETDLNFPVPKYDGALPASTYQCATNLLVIPQESRTITVYYKIAGSEIMFEETIPIPRIQWRMGHRYTYMLSFTPDEIEVDVLIDIADWEERNDLYVISSLYTYSVHGEPCGFYDVSKETGTYSLYVSGAGLEPDKTYTISEISDAADPTSETDYDWLSAPATVNSDSTAKPGARANLTFTVTANTGAFRTGYIKMTQADDADNYTIFTVNQASGL